MSLDFSSTSSIISYLLRYANITPFCLIGQLLFFSPFFCSRITHDLPSPESSSISAVAGKTVPAESIHGSSSGPFVEVRQGPSCCSSTGLDAQPMFSRRLRFPLTNVTGASNIPEKPTRPSTGEAEYRPCRSSVQQHPLTTSETSQSGPFCVLIAPCLHKWETCDMQVQTHRTSFWAHHFVTRRLFPPHPCPSSSLSLSISPTFASSSSSVLPVRPLFIASLRPRSSASSPHGAIRSCWVGHQPLRRPAQLGPFQCDRRSLAHLLSHSQPPGQIVGSVSHRLS